MIYLLWLTVWPCMKSQHQGGRLMIMFKREPCLLIL